MKPTINDNNVKIELITHKDSVSKKVTLCVAPPEWAHDGGLKFWTFVDDKFASILNRDQFRNRGHNGEDDLVIRKGTKGDVIVSASDLKAKMEKLMSNFEGDNLSRLQTLYAQNVKMIDYAQMRGNKARTKVDKEVELKKKTLIILNHKDVIMIQNEIKKAFESKRGEYIISWTKRKIERLEYLQKLAVVKGSLEKVMINYHSHNYVGQVAAYKATIPFFKVDSNKKVTNELKDNFRELANEEAIKDIDKLVVHYVENITEKVGGVIVNKNNLSVIENLHTALGPKGFEGDFLLKFNDKSEFTIHSLAVFAEGEIQCAHYRFPITFHDITFADNKFKKKLSEEDMLQQFK